MKQFEVEIFSWRMTIFSGSFVSFPLVCSILADGMMVPEIWTILFLPHNYQFIVHQSYYSVLCTVNY